MRRLRAAGPAALCLLAALSPLAAPPLPAAAGGLASIQAPPFTIVHPPSLAREAGQLAEAAPVVLERLAKALDAPPLDPATIYLVSRDSMMQAGPAAAAMPDWAAGLAVPWDHIVVIRADRIGPWRQRELIGVLAHETAHMLMAGAAGPGAGSMPPWFREGVSANLARDGEWLDFFYLWISAIPSSAAPLDDLSEGFSAGGSSVMTRAAYAGSYSFLRYAMQAHGSALPARVLRALREGASFEAAWRAGAGVALASDEAAWAASIRGRARWASILTSSGALWLLITLLVLLAWLIKRRRGARVMDRWSEEDPGL